MENSVDVSNTRRWMNSPCLAPILKENIYKQLEWMSWHKWKMHSLYAAVVAFCCNNSCCLVFLLFIDCGCSRNVYYEPPYNLNVAKNVCAYSEIKITHTHMRTQMAAWCMSCVWKRHERGQRRIIGYKVKYENVNKLLTHRFAYLLSNIAPRRENNLHTCVCVRCASAFGW